ncbi:hypothetical protein C8J57DRAFT_1083550 [Mycena rebaudengoi]|nr:hypothetical protein C8J57DRAFT_1083550 [Mycena rebaudengoi]
MLPRNAKSRQEGADGVPAWATVLKAQLEDGAGGGKWSELVEAWWKCEAAAKFTGLVRGHAAKLRPKQIVAWVRGARLGKGDLNPPIIDIYAYSVQWWAWWVDINPDWRVRTQGGKRLEREGEGSWSKLAIGGPNRLLNILICLWWWRNVVPEVQIAEWLEAVEDVHWAVCSME